MKAPPQKASMRSTLRVPCVILECREKDVLCGRAKQSLSNPGNRRYRAVIELYREQYQESNRRAEKSRLTHAVMKAVRDQDSRFLRPAGGRLSSSGWVELTEDEVYEKVSHALRCSKDLKDTIPHPMQSTQPAMDFHPHFARQAPSREPAAASAITERVDEDFRRIATRQRAIFRDLVEKRCQLLADYSDEVRLYNELLSEAASGTGTLDEILEDAGDGSAVEFHKDVYHEPHGLEVFPPTHAQLYSS